MVVAAVRKGSRGSNNNNNNNNNGDLSAALAPAPPSSTLSMDNREGMYRRGVVRALAVLSSVEVLSTFVQNKQEKQTYRCPACFSDPAHARTLQCEFCGELPLNKFSQSEMENTSKKERRKLCIDCRSPRCSNPGCPTCPLCRQPECNDRGTCGKDPQPVHQGKIPRCEEMEQWLKHFRCEAC